MQCKRFECYRQLCTLYSNLECIDVLMCCVCQGGGPVADLQVPVAVEAAPGVNVMHQQGQYQSL